MSTPLRFMTQIIFLTVARLDTMYPHNKLPNSPKHFTSYKNSPKFVKIHQVRQNTGPRYYVSKLCKKAMPFALNCVCTLILYIQESL